LLFGLQLQCVHNRRIIKERSHRTNKTIPFEEAKDTTCRNRLKNFGNQILDNFSESSTSILNSNSSEIVGITLKINGQLYQLCFKDDDGDEKKLHAEAVAQQLDIHNISQAGYRSLARIEPNLPRENVVSNVKKEITNLMNDEIPIVPLNIGCQSDENNLDNDEVDSYENLDVEIRDEIMNSQGHGGCRSIKKVLDYVIKILIKNEILDHSLDNKIYIRISGDGRNVGKKIKHVMVTFAILNDINNIFQPDNHYCLVLYSGIEKYEHLKNALNHLMNELEDIDKNGFIDSDGLKWKTILYFSSDWKFLSICLGINHATATHFCPWCLCSKSDHSKYISKEMDIIKSNYQAYAGYKHTFIYLL